MMNAGLWVVSIVFLGSLSLLSYNMDNTKLLETTRDLSETLFPVSKMEMGTILV